MKEHTFSPNDAVWAKVNKLSTGPNSTNQLLSTGRLPTSTVSLVKNNSGDIFKDDEEEAADEVKEELSSAHIQEMIAKGGKPASNAPMKKKDEKIAKRGPSLKKFLNKSLFS